ncbi:MAG TPA: spore coat protein CotJB [Clostridiales bacterium]|jgi:spore coat protein JB|nr:spore coat protein CotJB [Clostridiales bacterium]HBR08267.1 spore coat protein CotJB [Clostridiales bacterium]
MIQEDKQLENTGTPREDCGYRSGLLPECAPLALTYTPMQQGSEPAYATNDALSRGTLFPGLDLPFMNLVNKTPTHSTPLRELMAIDFVVDELELYLDTHKNDSEAFATYQGFLKLAAEGRERYVARYGPVSQSDMINAKSYTWLNDPWPWDIGANAEEG